MRIGVISDIHYERRELHSMSALGRVLEAHKAEPYDVLVVAGDFSTGFHVFGDLRYLCSMFQEIPVVFVAGNHEFYTTNRAKIRECRETLTSLCPNLKWLHRTTFTHKGVIFAGTTLWYPWSVEGGVVAKDWADFKHIEGLAKWVYAENEKDRAFLAHVIGSHDSSKGQTYEHELVVVTHMAPAWACIQEKWLGAAETNFFVGGCDRMLGDRFTWIHGHCHDSLDMQCGDTRVVRNPLGYEFQPHTGFDPTFHLEFPHEGKGPHDSALPALQ